MLKAKLFSSLVLAFAILVAQAGLVRAASPLKPLSPVSGTVQSITIETNPSTGVSIVIIALLDENAGSQEVQVSLESAVTLGLVVRDADGNAVINESALGRPLEIDSAVLLPEDGAYRHPVGNALAEFFADLGGLDYGVIMGAHEDGMGFGVIAQALWLTTRLEGDADLFLQVLEARRSNDYSAFVLDDGSIPANWGQLRKAILVSDGQSNLGIIISDQHNGNAGENEKRNPNGNGPPENKPGKGNDKENGNNGNGKGREK